VGQASLVDLVDRVVLVARAELVVLVASVV
jgi:hypothetical protein